MLTIHDLRKVDEADRRAEREDKTPNRAVPQDPPPAPPAPPPSQSDEEIARAAALAKLRQQLDRK